MNFPLRPYVQLPINAVDVVLLDLEGRYDSDQYDRYETFEAARDAALTSVEVMLDEQDYDDEEHRRDLEQVLALLETSTSFDDLLRHPEYQTFIKVPTPARSAA